MQQRDLVKRASAVVSFQIKK